MKENLKYISEYPLTNLKKWCGGNNIYKFFNIYSEFGSEVFCYLGSVTTHIKFNNFDGSFPLSKEGVEIMWKDNPFEIDKDKDNYVSRL